jgi:putative membrane protein
MAVCVGSIVTEDKALWLTEVSIPLMVALTLVYLHRQLRFSALAYLSITFLFLIHAVVAIHPIATSPLGFKAGALLGWRRNNIDHVLHFMGGLCLWRPVFEVVALVAHPKRVANTVLSIALVLSLSAGYELLEWKSMIMLGEKNADLFLGWQGDVWDAQKDMALNLAGAVLAAIIDCSLRFARRARVSYRRVC